MPAIVSFKNVSLGYENKTVLAGSSFEIHQGDCLAILGPNGSGKTTLLHAMMGLIKPLKGDIDKPAAQTFGYCMQRQALDTLFPLTVYEMVMMGRTKMTGPFRFPSQDDKNKVQEFLEITGCRPIMDQAFHDLSGGQKQRVLIARALSVESDLLILDEPTADLDRKVAKEILALVQKLQKQKQLTVVIVSHEIYEVINYAKQFLFLSEHVPQKIFQEHEVTGKLLSAVFEMDVDLIESQGRRVIVA